MTAVVTGATADRPATFRSSDGGMARWITGRD